MLFSVDKGEETKETELVRRTRFFDLVVPHVTETLELGCPWLWLEGVSYTKENVDLPSLLVVGVSHDMETSASLSSSKVDVPHIADTVDLDFSRSTGDKEQTEDAELTEEDRRRWSSARFLVAILNLAFGLIPKILSAGDSERMLAVDGVNDLGL